MAGTRARNLARLGNEQALSVSTDLNVGVNSTSPVEKLNVVGVVSATSFFGDGSNLEGVASAGLGTALGESDALSVIYYTDNTLTVGSTITVNPPDTTTIAYTQYAEIVVSDDADLIVAPGDDLVPDLLGLSTEGVPPNGGSVTRIRADNFTNHPDTRAPTFQTGVQVTGIATADGFSGNVTGTAATFTTVEATTYINVPEGTNVLKAMLFV